MAYVPPLPGAGRLLRPRQDRAAVITARATFTAGQKLTLVVGQLGIAAANAGDFSQYGGSGGGGGSFVYGPNGDIVVAAGGGGGPGRRNLSNSKPGRDANTHSSSGVASEGTACGPNPTQSAINGNGGYAGCGGGGAGIYGNGAAGSHSAGGGISIASSAQGGISTHGNGLPHGGFGGGGAGSPSSGYGGGAGGYSGGSGGGFEPTPVDQGHGGGGGGSFINSSYGATAVARELGTAGVAGSVEITLVQ